ncbi:MAG: bifunctional methylenetetrahydrofolate dehydrogenase/methenyltetrahydrofolate cyclohydrolase [Holosporaceae bacterium]|jgi:methylenetetrahydrofolate dehydrogenase (NADP+)/methenyltetrahydrofolate cyclohydrolase|nr:bifunctional methylenetetrahydrofolate dehydrogenase/methenyltetrahydrofolate cyclohydrolase [Holosporaceae bacterium]
MAKIIDGKTIAKEFSEQIKKRVDEIKSRGIEPRIAMIRVGENPASDKYISVKEKLAAEVGISSVVYKFGSVVKEREIADLIFQLNEDKKVHAILLQSPLPKNLQFRAFVNLIHPNKDVDGLTTINQGKLFSGEPGIAPCTPLGILHLLRTVCEDVAGRHAVVLGRSSIVGRPLAQLLLNANCTVTLLHSYSKDLPEICRTADILVSAVGKPLFVGKEFIKPGATVIDVGINRIEQNGSSKIVGDVDFNDVFDVAEAITPVPNGVGPMTVAHLMHNTLKLACYY